MGGMQDPPGHRNNVHSPLFREIGVGVVDGSNGSVGPQIVTQDFGVQQTATPLFSGVVYYDSNGNNFYDVDEGIGGVRVDVAGASYYAVTAISGGYAVPVPADGSYTLTFSAPGLATTQHIATVSAGKNVKVDYLPIYSPPVISGPNPASINQTNTYTFTPVGVATNYQWSAAQLTPYSTVQGAENGPANVTIRHRLESQRQLLFPTRSSHVRAADQSISDLESTSFAGGQQPVVLFQTAWVRYQR